MEYGTLVRLPEGCDLEATCAEKFGRIREMGLASCQLVYKPRVYKEADADVIRAAAEGAGITISAMFCGYYDRHQLWDNNADFVLAGINSPLFGGERLHYVISCIPFLKRLGVSDMILHAGYIPNDPHEAAYARMRSAVTLLAKHLGAAGCNLLFETGMESPIALLNLITDVGAPNLYVNLDTANLIMYGYGNPVDAICTIGKYVRNMHAKDGLPPSMPHSIGKEVPIGTGSVDFERVLSLLIKAGYDRYITVERELVGGDVETAIMEAIVYLKSIEERIRNENG